MVLRYSNLYRMNTGAAVGESINSNAAIENIKTEINMNRAMVVVSVLLHDSESWSTTSAAYHVFDMRRQTLRVFQQPHISKQNIRERTKEPTASSLRTVTMPLTLLRTSPPNAVVPPWFTTSIQTSVVIKYCEVDPKQDGIIRSSMTSILLASTTPLLPRWV